MSTNNTQFHDKIGKFPLIFVSMSYSKNFIGIQKQVRISHGKRAIGELLRFNCRLESVNDCYTAANKRRNKPLLNLWPLQFFFSTW